MSLYALNATSAWLSGSVRISRKLISSGRSPVAVNASRAKNKRINPATRSPGVGSAPACAAMPTISSMVRNRQATTRSSFLR